MWSFQEERKFRACLLKKVHLVLGSTNLCLVWVIGASVIQIMTKTSYKKTKDLEVLHEPVHLASLEHGEHCLTHVERVPPVVILDRSVVLLHTQSPSTYNLIKSRMMKSQTKKTTGSNLVRDWKFINEIKVQEHSYNDLESFAVLVEGVIELVAVEVEVPGQGDGLPRQPRRVVVRGGGVVGQAVQGNSLQSNVISLEKYFSFAKNIWPVLPWACRCSRMSWCCGSRSRRTWRTLPSSQHLSRRSSAHWAEHKQIKLNFTLNSSKQNLPCWSVERLQSTCCNNSNRL